MAALVAESFLAWTGVSCEATIQKKHESYHHNVGEDLGPALDVLLLPTVVFSLVRDTVGTHVVVQTGDASKISVGGSLEAATKALCVVEVEDSVTVENGSCLVVNGSADE